MCIQVTCPLPHHLLRWAGEGECEHSCTLLGVCVCVVMMGGELNNR